MIPAFFIARVPRGRVSHLASEIASFLRRRRNQLPSQLFVSHSLRHNNKKGSVMNSIIYLVGLVVVVMAVLSFVGLH
ncbi:MAG: hypothetical protein ABI414_07045 [Devosia sp.]